MFICDVKYCEFVVCTLLAKTIFMLNILVILEECVPKAKLFLSSAWVAGQVVGMYTTENTPACEPTVTQGNMATTSELTVEVGVVTTSEHLPKKWSYY